MHIIKLKITKEGGLPEELFEEDILEHYFESLYHNRQMVNFETHYEPIENGVQLNLFCPELDSYKDENSNIYAVRRKVKIETELGVEFEYKNIGESIDMGIYTPEQEPEFYILYSHYWSPLISGKTQNPIPLYKIPYTYDDGHSYDDINFWNNNYDRVYGLWRNGVVGERWMLKQLQNHDSDLNKQGRNCCKTIEKLTNIPTYYYLFNYRAWSRKQDRLRKCPNCGGNWLVTENTREDFYTFKCDKCRLLSEFSPNAR